jgi:hypothetical protein
MLIRCSESHGSLVYQIRVESLSLVFYLSCGAPRSIDDVVFDSCVICLGIRVVSVLCYYYFS